MASISLGTTVRVASRRELEADLRAVGPRPRPEQFRHADAVARVVGVELGHSDPRYRLQGLPGLWHERWLRPLGRREAR